MKAHTLVVLGAVLTSAVACDLAQPAAPQAAGPVVEITIDRGSVNPTVATLTAKVGQPITVRVNSDVPDELRVHSAVDRRFDIAPEPEQEFSFTADTPGDVAVELHNLARTVATVRVQP